MQQTKAYHRGLYRLPVTYPAMYCGMSTIGEGTITNLSAVGCTIELAHVRWANGKRAGIEFVQVEPTANLRLYGFVLDQMTQRAHTIPPHRATS